MRARKVSVTALAAAAAVLAVSGSASAQIDPGVNYDPGSPAGKEYAIPLVEGRSDGAGTTDWQQGANVPFGVGIERVGRRGGRDGGSRGGRRGASEADGNSGSRGGSEAVSEEQLTAKIRAAETPGGTAARTFVLALAVLLPAGLLALLLRQRPQASRTGSAV